MKLHAIRDSNTKPVDWWFMYKLPHGAKAPKGAKTKSKPSTGWEYLYFDAETKGQLALSPYTLDQQKGALQKTLQPIYDAYRKPPKSLGWIFYNDEIPGAKKNNEEKGHTKGVLAFDLQTDTAVWLLHSWPKFPDIKTGGKLASADYGQTYLCVTLKNVDAARTIAEQMYYRQEPQTYECHIPASLGASDIFNKVANAIDVNETDPPCDVCFLSAGGVDFRLMAKNRHWGKDFWDDLVGPHLRVNIDVETWRRGTVPPTEDSDKKHTTTDILWINLSRLGVDYEWHYTKDHAKWAVSETDDWVCVADINRQTSQEKRGGGTICFRNKELWKCLSVIEQLKQ